MYKLSKQPNQILRLSDNAYIPMDEANTDYQAYLAWVAEGNTPLPAESN
jgi:hypothetical protein